MAYCRSLYLPILLTSATRYEDSEVYAEDDEEEDEEDEEDEDDEEGVEGEKGANGKPAEGN